jgi:hypothetical protein
MKSLCIFLAAPLLFGSMVSLAHSSDRSVVAVDLSIEEFKPIKSAWEQYFCKNYGTARNYNKALGRTIRDYDGPNVMLPASFSVTNGYTRENVLHNFRNWRRPDARGLDANAEEIANNDLDVIYGAPISKLDGALNVAQSYALFDSIYGYRPELVDHVYIQWGNEINGKHIGQPQVNVNERLGLLEAGHSNVDWSQYNKPEDQQPFVENYFLPAVSTLHEVSGKLFKNPAAIKVMSPSFANIFNPKFREWMYGILEYPVDAKKFPGLGVRQTWQVIDVLTVHYPFAKPNGAAVMQEIWNRYGNKIGRLWVTEEYGRDTSGPAGLIDRALSYFSWIAATGLDANQTRLCWWGIEKESSGGKPIDAASAIGDWLLGKKLYYRQLKMNGEVVDAIYAEDVQHPRYMLAFRNGLSGVKYRIELSGMSHLVGIKSKATLYNTATKPVILTPLTTKVGDKLDIDLDVNGDGPLLLFIGD